VFDITCYVYGKTANPAQLFEDDGTTFNFEKDTYNTIGLSWQNGKGKVARTGNYKAKRYNIKSWVNI